MQSTNSHNFGLIKRYHNPPKLIETGSFCLLPTSCSVIYSIFMVRNTSYQPLSSSWQVISPVNKNSYNFGQIKRYSKPPKLIETWLLFPLPTPCSVLYLTFKVRKTSNQPLCSSWYGLSFAISNSCNEGRIKLHGNQPALIKTYLFCLFPTSCSVLYSIFKVRHKSDRPLCSSWRVLSASNNL